MLFMCGLPGGFPDDLIDVDLDALEDSEEGGLRLEGVIRISNADYLARPLRLTPTEATAIIVALRAMRGTAGADTREVVDRTLAKLEAAAAASTPGGTPLVEPGEDDDAGATRLRASLEDAVARGRQVRLTYYVPARDEESERVVDPRGVVTSAGVAYLDAWCHSAEAPRLFRLDRIHEAAVLDSAVETAPEPPRDLSDGLFQRSQETTLVTLSLQPQARWVVEYYQVEQVRPGSRRHRGGRPAGRRRAVAAAAPDAARSLRPRTLAPRARHRLPGDGTANTQPVHVRGLTKPA